MPERNKSNTRLTGKHEELQLSLSLKSVIRWNRGCTSLLRRLAVR